MDITTTVQDVEAEAEMMLLTAIERLEALTARLEDRIT